MANYRNNIYDIVNITKALGDFNRIRALMMLRSGELCVCQIIEMIGLAPSTVSKHMSILKQAGLVMSHKRGKWIYYCLNKDCDTTAGIINWIKANLLKDKHILADCILLEKVKQMDKDKLCGCYKGAETTNTDNKDEELK